VRIRKGKSTVTEYIPREARSDHIRVPERWMVTMTASTTYIPRRKTWITGLLITIMMLLLAPSAQATFQYPQNMTLCGASSSGAAVVFYNGDFGTSCITNGTLRVVKHVVNDNGGTLSAAGFTLHVKHAGVDVTGSPKAGSETGTDYLLAPDTYNVSENAVGGYDATFSGACDASGNVTVAAGQTRTCTITNNDRAEPGIKVTKVANHALVYRGDSVTYTMTVANVGNEALKDVVVMDDKCSPLTYVSGDTGTIGVLAVGEVWTYTCSDALIVDTTNTVTASGKGVNTCKVVTDTAQESVKVINPAIVLVKTASATLVNAGDTVAYTFAATNTGDDPLTNVKLVDDKCSPLVLRSGDLNNNQVLDPGETWVYTCSAVLNEATTNSAKVVGIDSLGGTVCDVATAFVDVIPPIVPPPVPPPVTPPVTPQVVATVTAKVASGCVSRNVRVTPTYANGTLVSATLYIDGKRVKTLRNANAVFTVNVNRYRPGTHRYTVVAKFSNGQTSTAKGRFGRCHAVSARGKVSPRFTG
jgi:uncharacterized repeat protein (TIGR01451 family)